MASYHFKQGWRRYHYRDKVHLLVIDHVQNGKSVEAIQNAHPHLTLAQIHAALAYYYDHREEMDADIESMLAETDRLLKEFGTPVSRAALRERAHIAGLELRNSMDATV